MSANVVQLRPAGRTEVPAPAARLLATLDAELMRSPPRPIGLMACVAWLQEPPDQLGNRLMASRALENVRRALFVAPGRDAEMALLWREALATACYARLVAAHMHFDAPLLTSAGLLHRVGEISGLRALARAELATGERLLGPVMQELMEAQHDELIARVTRAWELAGDLRITLVRWRQLQDSLQRPMSVTLLLMAQALATELVHAATCTPGLVEAAQESLRLPAAMVAEARAATDAIKRLLDQCAPLPVSAEA